ncbi:MAG: TatD family hydrolase [Planctomycetota bacterium]
MSYPRPAVIDTHCHLTFPDFEGRTAEILAEAAERGVTGCITISTTTVDCRQALAIATANDRVWCTSGVHPLHSHEGPHDWSSIVEVARAPECVAWGELGLDNHYDNPAPSIQRPVLEQQLGVIQDASRGDNPIDLPVVIHCREAFDDLIPVLKSTPLDPARFVFHCFTGGPDDARKVLDFGAMISFTGVVTYKNAREVREAAKLVPADRIMVETDAPFLSPEPHRGVRPCRPAFTRDTAETLAKTRDISFADFHAQLNENTRGFFGIDAR